MEPTPAPDRSATRRRFLQGKGLPSALVAGGAAVTMTIAGLGIAAAQTDDSTTTTPPAGTTPAPGHGEGAGPGHTHADHHRHARLAVAAEALQLSIADLKAELVAGRSIAQVAQAKGVDPKTVIDALVADAEAKVAQAVTDGRLTQAEADERRANLQLRITDFVNRTPSAGGERHRPRHHRAKLEAAATALGLTPDELRRELQTGTSLATIAGERNVPVGQVVSALVADAEAKLARAVTNGRLTQGQADERRADVESRITELVNRTPRPHERRHRGEGAAEAKPAS